MNTSVLRAVFLRNFASYFTNPTGYLFICVFVVLSTFVAFWPPEFFAANLANLDLLNSYFPLIMLVFVPAITMGIWADERRQGTDELLLTVPAGDFEIVLGKYLAAVAIYSASLLFSFFCNYLMLRWLSEGSGPDAGLFFATYVGYWFVGLAMLAIGMVASFLTANLTVGYVLGAAFNIPLVIIAYADQTTGDDWARTLRDCGSVGGQFHDFGRGIISFSGVVYFTMIVVVMLYLSMVLIGRRHWTSRQRIAMLLHYLARTVALMVVAGGLTYFFTLHDWIQDVTAERLSSLHPKTREMLKGLDVERPIVIDAYISPKVPESFVQTKLNLENFLRQFDEVGGNNVVVRIKDTERFTKEARDAQENYGITPREVTVVEQGTVSRDNYIFMHVAIHSGLQSVDPVYFDRGIPPEYELIRSVMTVAQEKRKRIGIVATDAQLYGPMNMQTFQPGQNWPIISELEKQYDVERVDLSSPIEDAEEPFDALLAVQPSASSPEQLDNLIAAIRSGIPTAIFEDPFPWMLPEVPPTSEERRSPGGMMGRMQPPPPTCKPLLLFNALGIRIEDARVTRQDYNPYPKRSDFPPELVFIDQGALVDPGEEEEKKDKEEEEEKAAQRWAEVYNQESGITSGLQQTLFAFPGSIEKIPSASDTLEITDLIRTGRRTSTVEYGTGPGKILARSMFGRPMLNPDRIVDNTREEYVLAVHIRGKKAGKAKDNKKDKGAGAANAGPDLGEEEVNSEKINVVYVADVDIISPGLFMLREQGEVPGQGIHFDFDNVPFVLNVLDVLAGEERFLDIRKRRIKHRTLTLIEEKTKDSKKEATDQRESSEKKAKEKEEKAMETMDKKLEELRNREGLNMEQVIIELQIAQKALQEKFEADMADVHRDRDLALDRIKTKLKKETNLVQNWFRFWAVALPPVLPLFLALVVWLVRRSRESQGVAETRLR